MLPPLCRGLGPRPAQPEVVGRRRVRARAEAADASRKPAAFRCPGRLRVVGRVAGVDRARARCGTMWGGPMTKRKKPPALRPFMKLLADMKAARERLGELRDTSRRAETKGALTRAESLLKQMLAVERRARASPSSKATRAIAKLMPEAKPAIKPAQPPAKKTAAARADRDVDEVPPAVPGSSRWRGCVAKRVEGDGLTSSVAVLHVYDRLDVVDAPPQAKLRVWFRGLLDSHPWARIDGSPTDNGILVDFEWDAYEGLPNQLEIEMPRVPRLGAPVRLKAHNLGAIGTFSIVEAADISGAELRQREARMLALR